MEQAGSRGHEAILRDAARDLLQLQFHAQLRSSRSRQKVRGMRVFVFQLKAFLVRGLVVEVSAASPFPTFWLLSTTTARVLQGTSPDCMDCNCWLLELRSSS
jgi:hypothetical protein